MSRPSFRALSPAPSVEELNRFQRASPVAAPKAAPASKKRKCPFIEDEAEVSGDDFDSDSSQSSETTVINLIDDDSEDDMPPFHPVLLRSPPARLPRSHQAQEVEPEEQAEEVQHIPQVIDLTHECDEPVRLSRKARKERKRAWFITLNGKTCPERLVYNNVQFEQLCRSLGAQWGCGQLEKGELEDTKHNHFLFYWKD
jgi:hypothetical protein